MHSQLNNGDSVSHAPGEKLVVCPKRIYLGDYALMFLSATDKATREAYEATPTLDILKSRVEHGNLVRIRSSQIAQILGVSEQTVERHLKKLRNLGLIVPDSVDANRVRSISNWRICPYIAWKGKIEVLAAYLKTLPKDHKWHEYADDTLPGISL